MVVEGTVDSKSLGARKTILVLRKEMQGGKSDRNGSKKNHIYTVKTWRKSREGGTDRNTEFLG